MRKLILLALFIIVASLLMAGCATPTPETIIQTVEVPKEVKVVETKEVEVVVTKEVEVVVTEEVIVEITPEHSEVIYERSETLYAPWLSHLLVDAGIFIFGFDLARDLLI